MGLRNLNEIFLLHRSKDPTRSKTPYQPAHFGVDPRLSSPHLYLETCLREIWIVYTQYSESLVEWARQEDAELFRGAEAFTHCLKITSGLKSAILGETEIFGQIKKAWAAVSKSHPSLQEPLGKWMMALFEDTKAIRTQFLQGKGGSSYGTLLRRLLKLEDEEKILVLGAGQLTESILPYFNHHSIRVWNRSPERIVQLKENIHRDNGLDSFAQIEFHLSLDLSWADQVIVCIPGVTSEVEACFTEARKRPLKIAHMGMQSDGTLPEDVQTLTHLFKLRDEVQEVRQLNLKRAERACLERALNRIPKACEQWAGALGAGAYSK